MKEKYNNDITITIHPVMEGNGINTQWSGQLLMSIHVDKRNKLTDADEIELTHIASMMCNSICMPPSFLEELDDVTRNNKNFFIEDHINRKQKKLEDKILDKKENIITIDFKNKQKGKNNGS
jgi:hypothetical protein|tara:strand:+ start:210 stop:575 length:366 start_codon:yes stop_codon:yes gene_type:complete